VPRDDATHELVRAKLALVSARPEAIRIMVDRSCVVLTGPVSTSERSRIVRSLARVRGVDSIVDLLSEEPDTEEVRRSTGRRYVAYAALAGLALGLLALGSRRARR
jgi:hypothetical protein